VSKSQRKYIDVNVSKKECERYLTEALNRPEIQKALAKSGKKTKVSSLGVWIIEQWLIENTNYRFKHFNTYETHATIWDRKLSLHIDIYPRPEGKLWCEYCKDMSCEHVEFSLTVQEIIEPLRKQDWKPSKV